MEGVWLVSGGVAGYWLVDIYDRLCVYFKLGDTKHAVHNVLTGLVIAVLGIWTVTSSGNVLASGVVLGLSVRLWIGFLMDKNYQRWYWMFAREFGLVEHRIVVGVWGALLLWQVFGLIR